MQDERIGAVMVVGGGIAGVQASLDLAESGYYVYLVEASPAIGGVMTQLDKTFPTNDCAMCIVSPKLVEAGRHLNIEIIAYSDIQKVEGEAGNFEVTVKKKNRYVDETKCTGCGECSQACPVNIKSSFNEGIGERKAIYKLYPQAFPNVYTIDKGKRAPCGLTCPARINVQGYVALTGVGKYKEALSLIYENLPLPGVLGRICPHPCEGECNRKDLDTALAICDLKRFLSDQVKTGIPVQDREIREERVAIVGSGPAGLTAAAFLARQGYPVTIFEALPVMGGMLYTGIPAYRLPREIISEEIGNIQSLGVEIKTNSPIGPNFTFDDIFKEGYQAIFLGIGAHKDQKLGIPGEGDSHVMPGVVFLRKVNLGEKVDTGERVAVIGGGNVAIDAARTALRIGAKEVTIVYRRSRDEMPANAEEIEEAEEEGVKFLFLSAPMEVVPKDNKSVSLKLVRMELSEPDASGRKRPVPVSGSDFFIEANTIISAIGQKPDLSFLEGTELETTKWGTITVDPLTLQTSRKGVFAGGDAVTGPGIAISAVAAGKEAATSISRYLRGEDLSAGREKPVLEKARFSDIYDGQPKSPREKMDMIPLEQRRTTFSEVKKGLTEEQAKREGLRCLNCGLCSECLQCVEVCKAEAVNHQLEEKDIKFRVGSIILSPGFDEYDANRLTAYGYGRFPNVVTSIQFERILSPSGPFQGHVFRPSDHETPKKIAWIQCCGSRNMTETGGNEYCGSVCCMYAIKEAVIAREHQPDVEPTIFYMDIRAYGKGFDAYYERAKNEHGVRFIRSMVSRIAERPKSKNLMITYVDSDHQLREEEFDLVVLSVGITPSAGARDVAGKLGVELDKYGFCKSGVFSPLDTSRPGIYVCGTFQSPKDIPETVAQASAAAANASSLLAPVRGTMTKTKDYPPQADISGEEPRVGVFVCHCGTNIGGVVDVPGVKEYALGLENVVHTDESLYTCSQDTQEKIKDAIREHKLNRVIVASCSPRTHEHLFRETIQEAGLNKYLFEMANIRDQCSWVHMREKEKATGKAKDLVRMAVANARLIRPLDELALSVVPKGLVIGGGVAGMTAALKLAQQGYEVFLVEKEAALGGSARNIHYTIEGGDVQAFLEDLIGQVTAHPLIDVITNAIAVDFTGSKGNFSTGIMVAPDMYYRKIEHGVTILATGAEESKPTEYLYGEDHRIVTQLELEDQIVSHPEGTARLNQAVMIQCVGSRDEQRPYCSRVCCAEAVKNALKLKAMNPHVKISILYRDMRTYGLLESYYTKAREEGVMFVKYDPENKPEVRKEGKDLCVSFIDDTINERITLKPDLLVLSAATIPRDNKELASLMKVSRTAEGFFLEAHMKLRPVDFATDGIYMAGTGHGPKLISESISQAMAAAARACTILSKEKITVGGVVAVVDGERCAACLTCVRVCPYEVPVINIHGEAEINVSKCQGCGSCVAECPAMAIELMHYREAQLVSKCQALAMDSQVVN
ncbi:MAG: FAD-dependent oxidoreductase [Syntrophales bacterium]